MSRPFQPDVGAALRKLREHAGYTLAEFSMISHTGVPAIGSYERGDRRIAVDTANELLAHFGYRLAVVPADLPGPDDTKHLPARLRALADHLDELASIRKDSGS